MAEGLARAGFDIDLRDGKAREDALVHVFLRARVEHKRDHLCAKTGNLFVEYRQKGRDSGIATTEADYWAFEYDQDCWLVLPTEKLKQVARAAYKNPKNRTRGGDNNQYEGVLVRITALVPQWGVAK